MTGPPSYPAMTPAGEAVAPAPSLIKPPTGFLSGPESIAPLLVTAIVLPAETGIANAELTAKIPAPPR